jgi:hypothetical protein
MLFTGPNNPPSMSIELISPLANIKSKLAGIVAQIEVVSGSEYPYQDSSTAVNELRFLIDRMIRRLDDFDRYPANVQKSLLRQSNYLIVIVTDLLGFIVRSTSTRNLFELYYPFKEISKKLVGEHVRLILSSDWQYSPFTYPYGLDELPTFILIGLPASESENALVFPTAGHELGHNKWRASDYGKGLALDLENFVYEAYEANRTEFERIFTLKGADIRNDMFVQPIIRQSVSLALRQSEELYCDFTGLSLFGKSYLFAFDYLLAPGLSSHRDAKYPSIETRSTLLAKYGASLNFEINGFVQRFNPEKLSGSEMSNFVVRMADAAVEQLTDRVFRMANGDVQSTVGVPFSDASENHALRCFNSGVPSEKVHTLGDLLNAAWTVFNGSNASHLNNKGQTRVQFLTDLVVKSAENLEYLSYRNA